MRNNNSTFENASLASSVVGSPVKPVFASKLRPDGVVELVQTGEFNLQASISAAAEFCDMSYILSALQRGDGSVLQQSSGFYGDVSVMPATYSDMLQLFNDARDYFDSLPAEKRLKYDNDFNKYFASLRPYVPVPDPVSDPVLDSVPDVKKSKSTVKEVTGYEP